MAFEMLTRNSNNQCEYAELRHNLVLY